MVNGNQIKLDLAMPNNKSDYGIIFISGIAGDGLSDRWKLLAEKFKDNGFYFLRYESWKKEKELGEYTIKMFHNEIDELISILKKKGCNKIGIIGKSFGGGLSLIYLNKKIDKMVLFAPAIGISSNNNINKWKDKKLSKIKSLTDIKLDDKILFFHKEPILIIHGTKDDVIPIGNSMKMCKKHANMKLEKIYGADHSYRNPKHANKIIRLSFNFFKIN
ncbi:MAG: YqiA/YcfP family alpha/beta fold hydrolase [Candidatus Micrarchaeaceae archaeon]